MEFLSNIRFIHRDLSARNILLDEYNKDGQADLKARSLIRLFLYNILVIYFIIIYYK